MPRFLRISVVVLLAAACSVKSDNNADTTKVDTAAMTNGTAPTTEAASTPAPVVENPSRPDTSGKPSATSWAVNEAGIGPIRVGMTVAQVNEAIGGGFSAPNGSGEGCSYATLTKAPKGLAVMLDNGKVARIEVRSGNVATANGARIGDTELKVMALYSGKITTTPHKYLPNGHYMTVAPSAANNRIVFETDGKKVINYRSGQQPQVEYVERCG